MPNIQEYYYEKALRRREVARMVGTLVVWAIVIMVFGLAVRGCLCVIKHPKPFEKAVWIEEVVTVK